MRKGKPGTVDDAVVLAKEIQSYLTILGQQPNSVRVASVNNLAGPSTSRSEMFSDLVFTIKKEVKRVFDDRNSSPRRGRSTKRSTSNRSYIPDGAYRNNRERNNIGNQGQRNRNNSRVNTPNRCYSQDSKTRVSFSSPGNGSSRKEECNFCHRINHSTKVCRACLKCGRVGHFRHECRSRSQILN